MSTTLANVRHEIPKGTKFTPCKRCTAAVARVSVGGRSTILVETDGTAHEPHCIGTPAFRERKRLEARLAELREGKS